MSTDATGLAKTVRRKVAWRILPLIFVLYVIAYLDRANVGFAKLRMADALGWSDAVFGFGGGIFFVGYLILEVPGALLVEHWSARKWFARILVTWGICSMGMAFVSETWQFYLARFLLGLAEAGFFPGVIVYFTHWFPRADRARALSIMILGVPISLALGARLSGFILDHQWFDLAGWKWVFLIEGAPAVLFGIAVPFLLSDRPAHAKWLSAEERDWLEQTIERERQEAAATGTVSLGEALKQPSVWILALGILMTNIAGYAMGFWMPTFIDNMLRMPATVAASTIGLMSSPLGQGPMLTTTQVASASYSTDALNYIALIYLFGLAGVWVSGQSSDRFGERKWHCVFGQVGAGVFLGVSLIPGQPFGLVMAWLCAMGFCALFWPSPFWVLPTLSLSASAAAVAVGVINICANVGGLLGLPIVGAMKSLGYDDGDCMRVLSCCYIAGGVIIAILRIKK
jgi:MFS transporter, ACS family, tartrate transporter